MSIPSLNRAYPPPNDNQHTPYIKIEPREIQDTNSCQQRNEQSTSTPHSVYLSNSQRDRVLESNALRTSTTYSNGVNGYNIDETSPNILEPLVKIEEENDEYPRKKKIQRLKSSNPGPFEVIDLEPSSPCVVTEVGSPFPSFVTDKSLLQNYISNMRHTNEPTIVTLKSPNDAMNGDAVVVDDDHSNAEASRNDTEEEVTLLSIPEVDLSNANGETRNKRPIISSSGGSDNLLNESNVDPKEAEGFSHFDHSGNVGGFGCNFYAEANLPLTLGQCLELDITEKVGSAENEETAESSVFKGLGPRLEPIYPIIETRLPEVSQYSPLNEMFETESDKGDDLLLVSAEKTLNCLETESIINSSLMHSNGFSTPEQVSVNTVPEDKQSYCKDLSKIKTYSRKLSKKDLLESTQTMPRERQSTDSVRPLSEICSKDLPDLMNGKEDPPVLQPEVPFPNLNKPAAQQVMNIPAESKSKSSDADVQAAEMLVQLKNQSRPDERGIEKLKSFSESFKYTSSFVRLTAEAEKRYSKNATNNECSNGPENVEKELQEEYIRFLNETERREENASVKEKTLETLTDQAVSVESDELRISENSDQKEKVPFSPNSTINIDDIQTSANDESEDVLNISDTVDEVSISEINISGNEVHPKFSQSKPKRKRNQSKEEPSAVEPPVKKSARKKLTFERPFSPVRRVTRSLSLAEKILKGVIITPQSDGIYLLHPRCDRKGFLFCPDKPSLSCLLPESMVLTLREKSDSKVPKPQTPMGTPAAKGRDVSSSSLCFKELTESPAPSVSTFKMGYLEIKGFSETGYNFQRKGNQTYVCPNFNFSFDLVTSEQAQQLLKTAEFSNNTTKPSPVLGISAPASLPSGMEESKQYITYFWPANPVEYGEEVSSAAFNSEGPHRYFIGISDLAVIDVMRLIISKNSHAFQSNSRSTVSTSTIKTFSSTGASIARDACLPEGVLQERGKDLENNSENPNSKRNPFSNELSQRPTELPESYGASYNNANEMEAAEIRVRPCQKTTSLVPSYEVPLYSSPTTSNSVHNQAIANSALHRGQYIPTITNENVHNHVNLHQPTQVCQYVSPVHGSNETLSNYGNLNQPLYRGNVPRGQYNQPTTENLLSHGNINHSIVHGQLMQPRAPAIGNSSSIVNFNPTLNHAHPYTSRLPPYNSDYRPPEPSGFNYPSQAQPELSPNSSLHLPISNAIPGYSNHHLPPPPQYSVYPDNFAPHQPATTQSYTHPLSYQNKDFQQNIPDYYNALASYPSEVPRPPQYQGGAYNNHPELQPPSYDGNPSLVPLLPGELPSANNYPSLPGEMGPPNYAPGEPPANYPEMGPPNYSPLHREQRLANYDLTVNQNRYRTYGIPMRNLLNTSGGNLIQNSPYARSFRSDTLGIPSNYPGRPPPRQQKEVYVPPASSPPYPETSSTPIDVERIESRPASVVNPLGALAEGSAVPAFHADVDGAVKRHDLPMLNYLVKQAGNDGDIVSMKRAEVHAAYHLRDYAEVEFILENDSFPERYLKEMQNLWLALQYTRELPGRLLPKKFSAAFKERHPFPERLTKVSVQILNAAFAADSFPSSQKRAELAERIGQTAKQVDTWFKNRRQKERSREKEGAGGECSNGRGRGRHKY